MSVVTEFDSRLLLVVIPAFGVQIDSTQSQQGPQIPIHYDVRSVLTTPPVVWIGEGVGCPASSLRDGG